MSGSAMESVRALNKYAPIITDLLCMAGVVDASRLVLRRWIALESHLAPTFTDDDKPVQPAPAPATPAASGWRRRIFSRKTANFLGFLAVFLGIEGFIVLGLPRLATAAVLDTFWGIVETWLITSILVKAVSLYMPFPQKVRYTRKNLSGPIGLEFGVDYPSKFRFGLIVAACLAYTISLFWTTFKGATILQPLMPAAWTIFLITSPVFPRIVIRSFVKGGLGVMLGAFAFTGLIITAINYFKPSDGSAPNSGSDVAEISPWLVQIMSIISAGLPFWLPGILLAITLRFDYSRDRSVALPNTHKTTDPVDVPAKVPAFRPTLFNAGLAATALSLVAARAIAPCFTSGKSESETQASVQLIGMFLCLVCVPGAIALRARSQGVLRDWWNYEETWIPKTKSTTDADDIADVEKALIEPTESESEVFPANKTSV
ncbi:hypothetical protein EHS25_001115 [Saitozyma podzolica]|uniref:Uncharacterized protein n=1 Tax=Saitozyma podzolica TaxID=1890683 RepID=A0A427YHG2_9TREE|nr:hypothetical protein EHS25_001115 [Saitozyma podzolica]